MTEFQALQLVSDLNGKSFDDMLAASKAAGHDEMAVKVRFQSLWQQGYISGVFQFGVPVTIFPKGLDRLDYLKKEAEKDAKEERQRRIENKFSVLQVLIPFVVFILGAVVDELSGFAELLLELLRHWIENLIQ